VEKFKQTKCLANKGFGLGIKMKYVIGVDALRKLM